MRACWLEGSDGRRVRIRPGGLMLGRGSTCDWMTGDLRASRRHAVVRMGAHAPELVPVGRNRTHINGRVVTEPTTLRAADRIDIPGLALKVVVDNSGGYTPSGWRVESAHTTMPIHSTSFTVSGDLWADLHILGWSGGAVRFHLVEPALLVETTGEVLRNGVRLPEGYVGAVTPGDRFGEGETAFVVSSETPSHTIRSDGPTRLVLECLPVGGWLTMDDERGTHTAWLPDHHRDLLITLLQPPVPYLAGDFVPDAVVRGALWKTPDPGESGINRLFSELRLYLVAVGINGLDLIERRARQTRVCLGAEADLDLL